MIATTVEDFLSFELFAQEFKNTKNGVKKSFNREELLSEQLLHFVREVHSQTPLKKINCAFDTKSHIINRWNEMVDNIDTIDCAPVLTLIFNPVMNFCIEDNETEIGAFEQFLTIVQSGNVDFKMTTFEYSEQSKLFIGFCLNNWIPQLLTYDFTYDKYQGVQCSLTTI